MADGSRRAGSTSGWVLIVLAYVALVGLWVSDPAWPWQERIESFHADYLVQPDGSLKVTETIDWHFGHGEHHGIRRDLITQHAYGNSDSLRRYQLADITASSPTGAPASVSHGWIDGRERIQVGDPSVEVDGDQTYVVSYTLTRTVNLIEQGAEQRVELYWNVTGLDTAVRTNRASATVRGPGPVNRTECFQGVEESRDHCSGRPGASATFTATDLGPHEGMTIVAAFDPSGFTSTEPELLDRVSPAPNEPVLGPLTTQRFLTGWGWAGIALPPLALLLFGTIRWRATRDEHYADLTPGLTQRNSTPRNSTARNSTPTGEDAPVRLGRASGVTAVQFQPPQDLQPGLARVLLEEKIDGQALSATLIDLNIRGYLSITEIGDEVDWKMKRLRPPEGGEPLRPYEKELLQEVFHSGNTVVLSNLLRTFSPSLGRIAKSVRSEVRGQGWFRYGPDASSPWRKRGIVLGFAGFVLVLVAGGGSELDAFAGLHRGLLAGMAFGLGCVLAGIIMHRLSSGLAARTAAGSAVLAQLLGFRHYLATAEADQIRFEEAENIFNRYLPYAMVFGVAERWVELLKQVMDRAAEQGVTIAAPTWYSVDSTDHDHDLDRMLHGVTQFSVSASATIEAPPVHTNSSSGSGGSSGFSSSSSSGGSSGGGGGGGGSSSW